ncbi:MAG: putative Ig domain-containing protein [Anaeromyxobacter sp.]
MAPRETSSRAAAVCALLLLAASVITACGERGVAAQHDGLARPEGLSYPSPYAVAAGTPFAPVLPAVVGRVTRYSVEPALPDGVVLDPETGAIGGAPSSTSPATRYTVVASNAAGTARFEWELEVIALVPSAGADRTVTLGDFVALDGTASTSSTGRALRYEWTLAESPAGSDAVPTAPGSPRPVLHADRLGTFVATLRVRDGTALSGADQVTVTVLPAEVRAVEPPAPGSAPVPACREIVTPGAYVLTADLAPGPRATPCLFIHDTSDVVLHCDGHRLADAPERTAPALALRDVARVTIRACDVETEDLRIEGARDVLLTDGAVRHRLGVATQPIASIDRATGLALRRVALSDVLLLVRRSQGVVIADSAFEKTRGTPGSRGCSST